MIKIDKIVYRILGIGPHTFPQGNRNTQNHYLHLCLSEKCYLEFQDFGLDPIHGSAPE